MFEIPHPAIFRSGSGRVRHDRDERQSVIPDFGL